LKPGFDTIPSRILDRRRRPILDRYRDCSVDPDKQVGSQLHQLGRA
jgi:hypothetical protein